MPSSGDVGRVLGFEPSETDRVAKMIPNQPGQSYTVEEAVDQIKDVKALYKSEERYRQLFDYSMTLEGLSRHASVHAAGVVIAPGPLDEYVPVCVQNKGSQERFRAERQRRGRAGHRSRCRNPIRHDLPRGRRDAQDGFPGPQDPDPSFMTPFKR